MSNVGTKVYGWLYQVLFVFGFMVASPYYLWRARRRGGLAQSLKERVGVYSAGLMGRLMALKKPVWIHAVSVGEMMLARLLIREMRRVNPGQEVVITCTTVTGRRIGEAMVDERTVLLFSPLDFLCCVRGAFEAIDPSVLVLVEGEVWPGMVLEAEERGVPVCLVNARLSIRSWEKYQKLRPLLQPVLSKILWVGLQSEREGDRFTAAGYAAHKLFVTGSMKFDVAMESGVDGGLAEDVRKMAGWSVDDPVFFAASTHPGEERIVLDLYESLKRRYGRMRLFLAPRHVERRRELEELLQRRGLSYRCRSLLNESSGGVDVVLLDTTGELRSLYSLATVAFVGKSLVGRGGQNFLEAARAGVAVVVGPHMGNFNQLLDLFLDGGALVQVGNELEFYEKVKELFADDCCRRKVAAQARRLIEAQAGSAERTARLILATIPEAVRPK